MSGSFQLTAHDTIFNIRHHFLYHKEVTVAQIRTEFTIYVSNVESKACYCDCGREKMVGQKILYSVVDVEKLSLFFQCAGREHSRASWFYDFTCIHVSLLAEERGLSKLRAVLGLLISVINAAISVSLSNVLWSPDTVQQQPVSSLAKLDRCHLLKTVSSY